MQRISASFLPPIALETGSATPMHRQLSEWFQRAIVDGRLRPGQRVPSSRSLASSTRISSSVKPRSLARQIKRHCAIVPSPQLR